MPHTELAKDLRVAVCIWLFVLLPRPIFGCTSLTLTPSARSNQFACRTGQLPDAELSSAGLKISPVDSNVPKEADALREDVYGLLPHVKITDLLLEVNRWTGFNR